MSWWSRKEDRLREAARRGDIVSVRKLLDRGADPNSEHASALYAAAANGHDEIVSALLDAGADIESPDEFGETILMRLARTRTALGAIAQIIQRGANLNVRTRGGETALHFAAASELAIVQVLLDAGADPCIRSSVDAIPLDIARHSHHEDAMAIVELLERATVVAGIREAATSYTAASAAEYYFATYVLVVGEPMSPVRATMARILLEKKSADEIITFCRNVRSALAASGDRQSIAKMFLKFENPPAPIPAGESSTGHVDFIGTRPGRMTRHGFACPNCGESNFEPWPDRKGTNRRCRECSAIFSTTVREP